MLEQIISTELQHKIIAIFKYLLKNIMWLILAFILAGGISYFFIKRVKPNYIATFTFVLSTDQGQSGIGNLAAQLGFDAGGNNSSNIFSGDNIIELFKSRSLIGTALTNVIDSVHKTTLLTLITEKNHPAYRKYIAALNMPVSKYSSKEQAIYRMIITNVGKSFTVFKKDKKLIFYTISANNADPDIAYFTAKCMLDEASKEFIETKTENTSAGIKLLQHQADSLSKVLRSLYSASASVLDQTYNLNPSISAQRTPLQYNQIRASALGLAYTEVMRNLESSKISLQRETPLYRIIDQPELPLTGITPNKIIHSLFRAVFGLLLMGMLLTLNFLYIKNKT